MEMPRNAVKRRLAAGTTQYGLWLSLADPVAAEIAAGAGFDWLLIDAEHGPNDLRTVLGQLQALAGYDSAPIVRPVRADPSLIKQYLDLGAQTILAPMVDTADQAEDLVRAVRYPPAGIRGVATARAARWGRVDDYWGQADAETCLIVQIETPEGLQQLEDIAAVDGVDALFIGPSDLGAALGHLGRPAEGAVTSAVAEAIGRVRAAGKPAGVLGATPELAREYAAAGASLVGVGVDAIILAHATGTLARRFRSLNDKTEAF